MTGQRRFASGFYFTAHAQIWQRRRGRPNGSQQRCGPRRGRRRNERRLDAAMPMTRGNDGRRGNENADLHRLRRTASTRAWPLRPWELRPTRTWPG
jgi:hypothetical protein